MAFGSRSFGAVSFGGAGGGQITALSVGTASYTLTLEGITFETILAATDAAYAFTPEGVTFQDGMLVGTVLYYLTLENIPSYSIVDTLLNLQMPINCVLHGHQPYKSRVQADDILPAKIRHKTTVSGSQTGRLAGDAPSFTTKTGNRGYD